MTDIQSKRGSQAGFTLVELSIVLVIIGLIIGGVLVGQELIKGAEIRAVVGQYERFNAGVNAFRGKYNAIPGDLLPARATTFGLDTAATQLAGGNGLGDGDGILEGSGGTVGAATVNAGEANKFWYHLSQAQLVEGNFEGGQTAATSIDIDYPRSRLGGGGGFAALSGTAATRGLGVNFFQLGNPNTSAAGVIATANIVTPREAFQIDTKADDGKPTSGIIIARGGATLDTAAIFAAAGDPTNCVTAAFAYDTPTIDYDMSSTSGNNRNCQLRMRMQ